MPDFLTRLLEPEPLSTGPAIAAVFLAGLGGLVLCFAGYLLFRVFQTVFWTIVGAYAGVALAFWLRTEPSYLDQVVGVITLSLLGGIFSWIFYRLFLGLTVGAAGFGLSLMLLTLPGRGGAWQWVLAGLIGLVLAGLVTALTRALVVGISALQGSANFVAAALMIGHGLDNVALQRNVLGGGWPWWAKGLTAGLWLALALAGGRVQYRLIDLFSPALSPEPRAKPPRQIGRGKPRHTAGRPKGRAKSRPPRLQKVR